MIMYGEGGGRGTRVSAKFGPGTALRSGQDKAWFSLSFLFSPYGLCGSFRLGKPRKSSHLSL